MGEFLKRESFATPAEVNSLKQEIAKQYSAFDKTAWEFLAVEQNYKRLVQREKELSANLKILQPKLDALRSELERIRTELPQIKEQLEKTRALRAEQQARCLEVKAEFDQRFIPADSAKSVRK